MFYLVEVEDYVRVTPEKFGLSTADAVKEQLYDSYSDFQDKDLGTVVDVLEVLEVSDGIIIPGDGAEYRDHAHSDRCFDHIHQILLVSPGAQVFPGFVGADHDQGHRRA